MQCVDLGGRRIIKKIFFFQAEDGIRDRLRSRGLGEVYKRQYLRPRRLMIKFSAKCLIIFVSANIYATLS